MLTKRSSNTIGFLASLFIAVAISPLYVFAKAGPLRDRLYVQSRPASGYEVSLYQVDMPTMIKPVVTTDTDGVFTFVTVDNGSYCLKVDHGELHWLNLIAINDATRNTRIDLTRDNTCGFSSAGTESGAYHFLTNTGATDAAKSVTHASEKLALPPPASVSRAPSIPKTESWPWSNKDVFLTGVFCIFTVLLVLYPIGRYLVKPWAFRRDRLFGLLDGPAIVFYYKQFRPGSKIGLLKVGDASLGADDYMKSFCTDFDHWYGRKYYIAPVCGLAVLSFACAWWMLFLMKDWIDKLGSSDSMHGLVAAAIGGAFVWIVSDEIDRLRRRDFTSSDVYYYIFRILLAVPFGWALTRLQVTLQVGIPVAFFLGAFPTTTLFTAARRIAGQQLRLGDDPTGTLELEKLQSIGKDNAERFKDEGISTIVQLAYADPVDLTIRTNFEFNYVIDCVSQALLWIYCPQTADLNLLSLRGAQEIAVLVDWLTSPIRQTEAEATIVIAAAKLNISEQALKTTLQQIALDPYTRFLINAWS